MSFQVQPLGSEGQRARRPTEVLDLYHLSNDCGIPKGNGDLKPD